MDRITRLQNLARAGFLARGVVYILLGYFALTAFGSQGTADVLGAIKDVPLGNILLFLVGLGLLGYGIYRLYGAALGIDAQGTGAKATAQRIGHAASGAAHLVLGFIAMKGVFTSSEPGSGGGRAGEAAGTVADWPGGELILWIVGLGFLAAAVEQATKAITAKFMYELDPDVPGFAEPVGRAGFAARAVIFAVLGWQFVQALLAGNPEAVGGIGQVLSSLSDTGWLFTLVALGLLLFGVYSLIMARYRTIRDDDVLARLKR